MNDDTLTDTTSAGADFGRRPTVVPFKPIVVTPKVTPSDQNIANNEIIKMLEDLLGSARAGKIRFAAVAWVDDGVAFSTWEPSDDRASPQLVTQSLGAVSYLHHRYNTSVEAGSVFP